MRVLTVRNVSDDLYAILARLARTNRRSLQQQVLVLLERARLDETDAMLSRAADIRKRLAGRELGNTVQEIREDRSR